MLPFFKLALNRGAFHALMLPKLKGSISRPRQTYTAGRDYDTFALSELKRLIATSCCHELPEPSFCHTPIFNRGCSVWVWHSVVACGCGRCCCKAGHPISNDIHCSWWLLWRGCKFVIYTKRVWTVRTLETKLFFILTRVLIIQLKISNQCFLLILMFDIN